MDILRAILSAFVVFFRNRLDISLEVVALRQQAGMLKRKHRRPVLSRLDRLLWIVLRRVWPRWSDVLVLVKPATVIAWHGRGSDYTGGGNPSSGSGDRGSAKRFEVSFTK